jgi:hypothetical protein
VARRAVTTAVTTACLLSVLLSACSSGSSSSTAGPSSGLCAQGQRLATATQTSAGSSTDFSSVQAAIGRERDVAAGLVPLVPSAYQADATALHNALVRAAQAVSTPPPASDPQAAVALYQNVAGLFTSIESNLTHLGAYLRSACHLNINLGVGSTTSTTPSNPSTAPSTLPGGG